MPKLRSHAGSARHPHRPARVMAMVAVAVMSATGCGGEPAADQAAGGGITGDVTVFAAASLTESFTQIGKDFEAANPGVKVTFNFAGSSALAKQINEGAPADVFASAAPANMKQVTDSGGTAGEAATFVRNRLEIAVPKGNPAQVAGLADFGKPERKIALCAEQVPCGAAAKKAFDAAAVVPQPDTLEQDVKAVLTKVRLGEVDAALVYRTDVRSADGEVEGIAFPESDKAINDYPIAPLAEAPNAAGAKAFVDYVRSAAAGTVLTGAGFDSP